VLRAIDEVAGGHAVLKDFFNGPVAVLMADEDPSQAVKIYKKYVDENELIEFKAAVISGNFYDSSRIEKIAGLPSKEVMIAKTVFVLNAPIQGLYNSLSGIIKKFLYALNDLKTKVEKEEESKPEVSVGTDTEVSAKVDTEVSTKADIDSDKPDTDKVETKDESKKQEPEEKNENENKLDKKQEETDDNNKKE
jgi:hypothetical protein